MKLLSSPPLVAGKTNYLTDKPLSLDVAMAAVRSPKAGAIVTFSGTVRDSEKEADINSITYEAYPEMAEKELRKIVRTAQTRWHVGLYLRHRIGKVPVAESSVVIACSGAHRREVYQACQFVIEEIKSHVPIWKVEFER